MITFKEFLNERLSTVKPIKLKLFDEYEGGCIAHIFDDSYIVVSDAKYDGMCDYKTALTYCSSIEIEGTKGWVLGDLREMEYIVDINDKLPDKYKLLEDFYVTSDADMDMYDAIYVEDGDVELRGFSEKELCRPIKVIKKGQ